MANQAREMESSMENVTNAANGDTPRGTALRTKARVKGSRAKERPKEKGETERDSNRQRANKEEKAEAHHRG